MLQILPAKGADLRFLIFLFLINLHFLEDAFASSCSVVLLDLSSRSSLATFFKSRKLDEVSRVKVKGRVSAATKLAAGSHGTVFFKGGNGKRVIKVANSLALVPSLREEVSAYPEIRKAGFRVAKIFNRGDSEPLFLEKEYIKGPTAKDIRDREDYTPDMIKDLAEQFIRAYENDIYLDVFRAENFVWSEEERTFVLVDAMLREFTVTSRMNFVSLRDWTQEFFSNESDRKAFKRTIRAIKGEKFWRNLTKHQDDMISANHALKHFDFVW